MIQAPKVILMSATAEAMPTSAEKKELAISASTRSSGWLT